MLDRPAPTQPAEPGKPEKRRDAPLPSVGRPMLVVQGSRDGFGTPQELEPVLAPLSPPATLHVVEGGDHSFKVARAGAAGQAAIDEHVRRTAATWMQSVMHGRTVSRDVNARQIAAQ